MTRSDSIKGKVGRTTAALALAFGPLFLTSPASANTVAPCDTYQVNGGDQAFLMSLNTPLEFGGAIYDGNVYVSPKGTITFGQGDFTFWDYPATPSISIGSYDYHAFDDSHPWGLGNDLYVRYGSTETSICVDWKVLQWGQSAGDPIYIRMIAYVDPNNYTWTPTFQVSDNAPADARYGLRYVQGGEILPLEIQTISEPPEEAPVVEPEPEATSEPEPTESPTVSPEPTESPTVSPEPTESPTVSPEPSESPTVSPEEPSPAPEPEPSPEPSPSVTPEPQPTPEPTPEPSPEPTPEPTLTPQPKPVQPPQPEPVVPVQPEPSEEPEPVVSETPLPTPTPEPEPSSTPEPTQDPAPSETPEPITPVTKEPTPTPSPVITPSPTPSPTPTIIPEPVEPKPEKEVAEEKINTVLTEIADVSEITPEQKAEILEQKEELIAATNEIFASAEPGSEEYEEALEILLVIAEADDPELPEELAAIPLLGDIAGAALEVFNDLGNVGADISPEVREQSEKVVIASVIVANIALTATSAATSAASVAARRP